jgi:hypothetical protein
MRLIDDVIEALRKSDCRLEDALILAQVLAHKLGDLEMAAWVDAELKGYKEGAEVPAYRRTTLAITGILTNGHFRYSDHPIVLTGLKPEQREWLTTRNTTEGVGAIQDWVDKESKGKQLSTTIPTEMCGLITRKCYGGSDYWVEQAWGRPGTGAFRQIQTEIRSRLLQLALQLQDRVPADGTDDDVKKIGEQVVRDIFRGTVIGDNATIVIGDANALHGITNSVVRNDFPSLAKALSAHGVADEDVDALHKAVKADVDAPEHKVKEFGPRVRHWIGGMAEKAGTEAWKTVAATGVTTLYSALKAHYGWP